MNTSWHFSNVLLPLLFGNNRASIFPWRSQRQSSPKMGCVPAIKAINIGFQDWIFNRLDLAEDLNFFILRQMSRRCHRNNCYRRINLIERRQAEKTTVQKGMPQHRSEGLRQQKTIGLRKGECCVDALAQICRTAKQKFRPARLNAYSAELWHIFPSCGTWSLD